MYRSSVCSKSIPKFFRNSDGVLEEESVLNQGLKGLWQRITPFDMGNDGDMDYLLGNWGLNSKFKASERYPMKMYYGDIDENGSTETILAIEKGGKYYTLEGLDGLSRQLISLRKKFTAYKDFAGKTVEEVFGSATLKSTTTLKVEVLESGYLKNDNGAFNFYPFTEELQVAPIMAFVVYDFDNDGKSEALAGGNYFGVKPFHGRLDGFTGAIIKNETNIVLGHEIGLDLTHKSVRDMNIIPVGDKNYLLVTINNDRAQLYKIEK